MKAISKDLSRLKKMSTQSAEHPMLRNYLELVADLPWSKASKDVQIDLKAAKEGS